MSETKYSDYYCGEMRYDSRIQRQQALEVLQRIKARLAERQIQTVTLRTDNHTEYHTTPDRADSLRRRIEAQQRNNKYY